MSIEKEILEKATKMEILTTSPTEIYDSIFKSLDGMSKDEIKEIYKGANEDLKKVLSEVLEKGANMKSEAKKLTETEERSKKATEEEIRQAEIQNKQLISKKNETIAHQGGDADGSGSPWKGQLIKAQALVEKEGTEKAKELADKHRESDPEFTKVLEKAIELSKPEESADSQEEQKEASEESKEKSAEELEKGKLFTEADISLSLAYFRQHKFCLVLVKTFLKKHYSGQSRNKKDALWK